MKRRIKDALKRLLLTMWEETFLHRSETSLLRAYLTHSKQPKRHSAASIYLETR